jgi:hypothetical protein
MALETLKKLCDEAPVPATMIDLMGWNLAARLVLPKLLDLALACRDGDQAKIKQALDALDIVAGKKEIKEC